MHFLFISTPGFTMQPARREHGVVLVEFALVLPLLAVLVFGFLKFGVAMNAKIDSTHLTAEGTRYITVNQNPGLTEPGLSPKTLQAYIRSKADTTFLKGATVCISYPTNTATGTSGKVGDPVTVTVSHTLEIIPLLSNLAPSLGDLPVASEATMRLEALPTKIPAGCLL